MRGMLRAAPLLRLTTAHWRAITDHLTAQLPNEACGLLGGPAGQVRAVYPVANVLNSPVAYQMDPAQQLAVFLELETAGWELTAIFHSHPAGPAGPSPTDIAQAYYPEALYLTCAPEAAGRWRGRAFRLEAGQATEVPVEIAA